MGLTKEQAKVLQEEIGLADYTLLDIGEGMYTFDRPPDISPVQASDWLGRFNVDNRTPKMRSIEKMVHAIRGGYWQVTHQGAAFRDDRKGGMPVLGDGQNRLYAIERAKITVKLRVFIGLTKRGMYAVDGGIVRSDLDQLTIQEIETSRKELATLKYFLGGRAGALNIMVPEAEAKALLEWKGLLNWCFTHLPGNAKGGITVPLRAATMRAHYGHQKNQEMVSKIEKLCLMLVSGENITDSQISKFRNNLPNQNYGGEGRKIIYHETEDVLYRVLTDDQSPRLKKSKEERWKLPHELEEGGEII